MRWCRGECKQGIAKHWNTNLGTADPLAKWEAFKTTLWGTFMSTTGVLRKNTQQRTEELENAMPAAESAYVQNPDPVSQYAWLYRCRE